MNRKRTTTKDSKTKKGIRKARGRKRDRATEKQKKKKKKTNCPIEEAQWPNRNGN